MAQRSALKIGFIGDGGISRSVRDTLRNLPGFAFEVAGVLNHGHPAGEAPVETIADLLATRPDVIVECAGHAAIADYGCTVLRAGVPLLVVSIGSLADDALLQALRAAAEAGGTRIMLAAGAMAGIDALSAARLGGLSRVRYRGSKPPTAWRGTPAEESLDLATLEQASTFYTGNAREAALLYPKNSNVAATIALAGVGFERTEVELVADPGVAKNIHELMFEGEDGRFEISICGEPSKANPKTSALTAHSIARLLCGMAASMVI